MSGRVRKQSDCPVGKQGPMRATLPVSSVMKGGSLKKSTGNSPTLSPTNVWRRISPDHALSGQRSPGAVNYKGLSWKLFYSHFCSIVIIIKEVVTLVAKCYEQNQEKHLSCLITSLFKLGSVTIRYSEFSNWPCQLKDQW